MIDTPKRSRQVSTLSLEFQTLTNPDWPVVRVLVDGQDPFTDVAPEWAGFDPAEILGKPSHLLPLDDGGRRVAVYRCSCGIEGCGVIAPVIVPSPDRRFVSWVDFRDFTGVFIGPLPMDGDADGKPWDLPDIHFAYGQYVDEVSRASRDGSWESPRRQTARLLRELLEARAPVLPSRLRLQWVSPSWDAPGMVAMFERSNPSGGHADQLEIRLTSRHDDPEQAAADMATQLFTTPPSEWAREFHQS